MEMADYNVDLNGIEDYGINPSEGIKYFTAVEGNDEALALAIRGTMSAIHNGYIGAFNNGTYVAVVAVDDGYKTVIVEPNESIEGKVVAKVVPDYTAYLEASASEEDDEDFDDEMSPTVRIDMEMVYYLQWRLEQIEG